MLQKTNCFHTFVCMCVVYCFHAIHCFYRNDRYDDLRACLGEGLLQQLQQQQLFMVGTD